MKKGYYSLLPLRQKEIQVLGRNGRSCSMTVAPIWKQMPGYGQYYGPCAERDGRHYKGWLDELGDPGNDAKYNGPGGNYELGKAIKPAVKVSGLNESCYTVSYADNTKIGTAVVTITAKGENYKGTITKTPSQRRSGTRRPINSLPLKKARRVSGKTSK